MHLYGNIICRTNIKLAKNWSFDLLWLIQYQSVNDISFPWRGAGFQYNLIGNVEWYLAKENIYGVSNIDVDFSMSNWNCVLNSTLLMFLCFWPHHWVVGHLQAKKSRHRKGKSVSQTGAFLKPISMKAVTKCRISYVKAVMFFCQYISMCQRNVMDWSWWWWLSKNRNGVALTTQRCIADGFIKSYICIFLLCLMFSPVLLI